MRFRINLKMVFLFALLSVQGLVAQTVGDWEKLKDAYADYFNSPSAANLGRVDKLVLNINKKSKLATPVPQEPKSPNEVAWFVPPAQKAAVKTLDYVAAHFIPTEKKIKSGNRDSIRLAYHLRPISGGGEFGENLDILLDSLIHSNPELYLEELSKCRKWVGGRREIGELVTFLGGEFADQEGQPQAEYKLRILDLRKVRKPSLKNIRNECIEALRDGILKDR